MENRVKERDWFDFEWYIRRRVPLHLHHFVERALQTRDIDGSLIFADFLACLQACIQTVDFEQAKLDIARFVPDPAVDRKSTRLNSSHVAISYAVFCLTKKTH